MSKRTDVACEITVFDKTGGVLTKKIGLSKDGALESDGSECRMANGWAYRTPIADLHALAAKIAKLRPYQAIALGALRDGLPDKVKIVTKKKLNGQANTIARTGGEIVYREKHSAFVLMDFDRDGMPKEVAHRVKEDFWGALTEVLPALRHAAHIIRSSTSAGLFRSDTDENLGGSGGLHGYVMARDGSDAERFLTTLHDRCWLHGLGWIKLGAAGQMLERSVVDRSVTAPERLVFEGAPILKKPLKQDRESRRPIVHDGDMLDTLTACPPLTPDEQRKVNKLKAEAKERIKPQAKKVEAAYVEKNARELVERTGVSKEAAVQQIKSRCRGVLLPDVMLPFVDKELEGCTVADVLADPERFDGCVLADPIEGVSYGRTTSMVMLRRSDGHPWIKSFAHGGMSYTLESGADVGVKLRDFYAYMPMHNYIFAPSREPWPAASVNARIAPIVIGTDAEGGEITIKASTWIDRNQPVEQMTWAPGMEMVITDRLIANGGWIERKGVSCFNLYRPPTIKLGDASKAGPWRKHIRKIYPTDADHIIKWFAWRVQHPEVKINHALVLGSNDHGIGKDTLIEPVKRAIGHWNFDEVSPQMVMGEFTGFLRNVILRINEARDLGDVNRYQFHDHMKAYTAAPPDVLRVNEKHLREYSVLNCVGVIITTNHKTDGIFLPAEDRRHYVAWSESVREDFEDAYWKKLWGWYEKGGDRHVAAYLMSLDISDFDPKAPPPRTAAFWDIVDANRAPEEGELQDVLDKLGNPDAVTLADVVDATNYIGDFHHWLEDRKNRRSIPHRFDQVGYTSVRNEARNTGLWVVGGVRQVVYAKKSLSLRERLTAVAALQRKAAERKAAEEAAKQKREAMAQGKGVRF